MVGTGNNKDRKGRDLTQYYEKTRSQIGKHSYEERAKAYRISCEIKTPSAGEYSGTESLCRNFVRMDYSKFSTHVWHKRKALTVG